MEDTLDIGIEIITELKMKGIVLDGGLRNLIILKVAECYESGLEVGLRQGMDIAFREFEEKLNAVKERYIVS
ncbi:MAG TPA: hypothetical protein VIM70_09735 [Clostridium sp.]|uniref:hypothetical protein n=1 Tax=Clostridium sp. TaxID=1506 RepID=UPI002F948420